MNEIGSYSVVESILNVVGHFHFSIWLLMTKIQMNVAGDEIKLV